MYVKRVSQKGGVGGWVGENSVCEARRALRFPRMPRSISFGGLESASVSCKVAFRRFYFDGPAVGKFEVGIGVDSAEELDLNRKQVKDLITNFLRWPVCIPDGTTAPSVTPLLYAGRDLAKIYRYATLRTAGFAEQNEVWWIRHGTPLLFVTHASPECPNED
jgi:hypothetical protein